uniref:NodB homology domain-containing protein n=1 Tax=Octactis speculum TaxID=3111310 RepID=A0A7S2CLU8_9STRA|mmetsp:Transcript_3751/g.4330  ORF Transcript_3751/g.4330 Transcript_3751/m.4330 type:complete len:168 (+) Transcript_3751:118-621(+)
MMRLLSLFFLWDLLPPGVKRKTKFQECLDKTHRRLSQFIDPAAIRFFRAPMGMQSATMAEVVREKGLVSVLGDVYSNDPAIGSQAPSQAKTQFHANFIAHRVRRGSVVIMHVPQRFARHQCSAVLRTVLPALKAKGLSCVPLSVLYDGAQAKSGTHERTAAENCSVL